MGLQPDTATIYFEVQTSPEADATTRATLSQAAAEKVQRMDPTDERANWTFPIGPSDPTMVDQLSQINQRLGTLTGDESAEGLLPPTSFSVFYCLTDQAIICYVLIPLIRTKPSQDNAWGGSLGSDSEIAFLQQNFRMPLMAVYAFARALPS